MTTHTSTPLDYRIERTVVIQAPREIVFRYFTQSELWAAWWGKGSTIEPRPGGAVLIRHPNGIEVTGEVLSIAPPDEIVFTYGYASGEPIAPSGSRVTIRLTPRGAVTQLDLTHDFADESARDHHVQGWRYQLSLFINIVANQRFASAASLIDRWFDAWNETDSATRLGKLGAIASATLEFRDAYSAVRGLNDVNDHISASHQFMPGFHLEKRGSARHCQGLVLADWSATGPDGATRGQGTNAFQLGPELEIETVTGFWNTSGS